MSLISLRDYSSTEISSEMERKLADQNLVGVIVIRKNAVPFEGRDLIRELINYLETKGYHVLPKEDSEECHVAYFK